MIVNRQTSRRCVSPAVLSLLSCTLAILTAYAHVSMLQFTPPTQTRASAPVDASQDSIRPSPSQSSRNPDALAFTPSASAQDIEDVPEDTADGKGAGDDVELTIEDEAATPSQEPEIVRKGSLTPGLSTLEWAQKMKAQAAEEQRLRDQEKYAGLSPQEIVRAAVLCPNCPMVP